MPRPNKSLALAVFGGLVLSLGGILVAWPCMPLALVPFAMALDPEASTKKIDGARSKEGCAGSSLERWRMSSSSGSSSGRS